MEVRGARMAPGCRFGIVVSTFNVEVTDGLLKGALAALGSASVRKEDITVVRVPGAFEIPIVAIELGTSGRYDAVICLGCLIKGDTMHFEYIASSACSGIADAAAATGVPMALGVLTTLTEEQALERAADGPGNKGREAAEAAIEMATLMRMLRAEKAK